MLLTDIFNPVEERNDRGEYALEAAKRRAESGEIRRYLSSEERETIHENLSGDAVRKFSLLL